MRDQFIYSGPERNVEEGLFEGNLDGLSSCGIQVCVCALPPPLSLSFLRFGSIFDFSSVGRRQTPVVLEDICYLLTESKILLFSLHSSFRYAIATFLCLNIFMDLLFPIHPHRSVNCKA
jgi:hypothetical protein